MKSILACMLVLLAVVAVAAGPNVVRDRRLNGPIQPFPVPAAAPLSPPPAPTINVVAASAASPAQGGAPSAPAEGAALPADTRLTDANPAVAPVYELNLAVLNDIAQGEEDQAAAIAFAAQHQAYADQEVSTTLPALNTPVNGAVVPSSAPVASHALMEVSAPADRFIQLAKSKVGARYVYGAAGPTTFDCSGLVNWAAKAAGVKVPIGRTADQLYHDGKAIATTAARLPGDLIFFGKPGKPAYHVGIYLGNGQMLDAPHTGAFVRVEAYKYWPDQLTTARRIFY